MFNKNLLIIESDAKLVIDQCIETMRSTELGIELIRNIENINTRRILIDYIQTKYDGVVKKFLSELERVEHEFQVGKSFILIQTVNSLLFYQSRRTRWSRRL